MKINSCTDDMEYQTIVKNQVCFPGGTLEEHTDVVIREYEITLSINLYEVAKLVCTPTNIIEMIVGRLLTEQFISSVDEISEITIEKEVTLPETTSYRASVLLNHQISFAHYMGPEPTGCPGNRVFMKNGKDKELKPLTMGIWKPEWVFQLANAFSKDSEIHKKTKGTHSCYLSVNGTIIFGCEDLGRHNALDKAIGYAALNGHDPSTCILFTTGRVPSDMVKKAIAAKVPVLVSKAVPTREAVCLAEKYHLTLLCKAWPDKCEVYHPI